MKSRLDIREAAGLAYDRKLGIHWMLFGVGEWWIEGRLIGEPITLKWEDASKINPYFAFCSGWRLPTFDEFRSLSEDGMAFGKIMRPEKYRGYYRRIYWTSDKPFCAARLRARDGDLGMARHFGDALDHFAARLVRGKRCGF